MILCTIVHHYTSACFVQGHVDSSRMRRDGAVMVLVRLWRYDDTIKLGGDQLLQCIEEG